jgi:hypothetical protein
VLVIVGLESDHGAVVPVTATNASNIASAIRFMNITSIRPLRRRPARSRFPDRAEFVADEKLVVSCAVETARRDAASKAFALTSTLVTDKTDL